MTCCSGSGEILIVPREGGPSHNIEPFEGEPPLPQDVISSWEEFLGFASEEDAPGGMRERMHELRTPAHTWPRSRKRRLTTICAVSERIRESRAATRNWRVSLASPLTELTGTYLQTLEVAQFLARTGVLAGWHLPSDQPDGNPPVRIAILDSGARSVSRVLLSIRPLTTRRCRSRERPPHQRA